MRILVVTRAFYPAIRYGGPVSDLLTTTKQLGARGHEMLVLCSDMAGPGMRGDSVPSGRFQIDGVHVRYLRTWPRFHWEGVSLAGFWIVPRAVEWADVVHICGTRHFLGLLAIRACGRSTPYIVMPQGSLPPRSRNIAAKKLVDTILTRRAVAWASRLIANSPAEGGDLEAWGADPRRISVQPPAAPVIAASQEDAKSLRRRWAFFSDARILLWIGRVHPEKGLDRLLEALADRRVLDVHLILAGPIEDRGLGRSLRDLAGSRALRGRVRFIDWVDANQKAELYALADAFILPSRRENFGLAAAEALAAGLPVIATDTCGMSAGLRAGGGIVCSPDVGSIAAAIDNAIHDSERLKELRAGTDLALKRLGWPPQVGILEALYAEAIQSSGP